MKPTAWMPFYGNDFFAAVRKHDELVIVAYLRAIWHYWSHEQCQGIEDDDEGLRRICEIERHDWPRVKAVVFDCRDFFSLGEDGLWHQKRAAEEWAEAKQRYDAQLIRLATRKRKHGY